MPSRRQNYEASLRRRSVSAANTRTIAVLEEQIDKIDAKLGKVAAALSSSAPRELDDARRDLSILRRMTRMALE